MDRPFFFQMQSIYIVGIPGTQMGPLVLIGCSALFWRVDRLKNRGHLGSRYI